MLIRICLVIAIIAALAAGALNFVKVKEKITVLKGERDDWHQKYDKTDADLTRTKGDLDKTAKDLKQTQEKLASTEQERDTAVTAAAAATKRAEELTETLAKTTQDLNNKSAELAAYVATGYKPEQISSLGKQIQELQVSLTEQQTVSKGLQRDLAKKIAELSRLTIKDYHTPVPANLQGKVVASDPKWDFVVLDVGADDQVLEYGELLVNRNGRLVAKLRVSEVQKGRSIANVMPGWKIGDVMEGDQVIPAYMPE